MTREEVEKAMDFQIRAALTAHLKPAIVAAMLMPPLAPDADEKAAARRLNPMLAWLIDRGVWEIMRPGRAPGSRAEEAELLAFLTGLAPRFAGDFCRRHPDPTARTLVAIRDFLALPPG